MIDYTVSERVFLSFGFEGVSIMLRRRLPHGKGENVEFE